MAASFRLVSCSKFHVNICLSEPLHAPTRHRALIWTCASDVFARRGTDGCKCHRSSEHPLHYGLAAAECFIFQSLLTKVGGSGKPVACTGHDNHGRRLRKENAAVVLQEAGAKLWSTVKQGSKPERELLQADEEERESWELGRDFDVSRSLSHAARRYLSDVMWPQITNNHRVRWTDSQ